MRLAIILVVAAVIGLTVDHAAAATCKELLAADYQRKTEQFERLSSPVVESGVLPGNACNVRAFGDQVLARSKGQLSAGGTKAAAKEQIRDDALHTPLRRL